jgi:hypothetical protein
MRTVRRVVPVLAMLAAIAGAALVNPGTASASFGPIRTTDPGLGGSAWFDSYPDPEDITVLDMDGGDKYAVVAELRVRQDDGSWVRRMRARAAGWGDEANVTHNVDEGRRVELTVCLEERGYIQVYCNSEQGWN